MQLYYGDCLEIMDQIPDNSVDMVLIDPPYGIDFQSGWMDKSKRRHKILNDKKPFTEFIPKIKRLLSPRGSVMVFTRWDVQQVFIDEMDRNNLKIKNVLIWDKQIHGMGDLQRAYASRYESILFHSEKQFAFSEKRLQDIISVRRVLPKNLKHPNEKPVELLETLIKQCTRTGDTVADFCMGSGTTGVACVNTGRNFIGIELDADYYAVAARRIAEAQEEAKKHVLPKTGVPV